MGKSGIHWIIASTLMLASTAIAAPGAPADKVKTFRVALTGRNGAEAAAAATALGKLPGKPPHEALLDGLAWGLGDGVADKALLAVAPLLGADELPILRPYLGHRNPAIRAAAYRAVAVGGGEAGRALLLRGLGDPVIAVREVVGEMVAKAKLKAAIPALLVSLDKGDAPAIKTLAAMADVELARTIGEHLGTAPDAAIADCLGRILLRADFGPDAARIEVLHAIGKLPGAEAMTALSNYLDGTPKSPPRPSRKEAETLYEQRVGGDL